MAAPATPSGTLPKSNFHTANVTASRETPSLPEAVHVDVESTCQTNEDFAHPDHVVPPRDYSSFENLVVVCCHAIFHPDVSAPNFPLHSPYNEDNWYLAPFQKSIHETGKPGEHETFMAHALAGVNTVTTELAPNVPDRTLLVFSGGSTKRSLTALSEARSYYHALLAQELVQDNQGGGRAERLFSSGRILLEEHATDSFQNLLFSILLFRRTTGHYPTHIRVITHAFKAKRFLDLHAPTIMWPSAQIQVHGIDPVMSGDEREETVRGEEKSGYTPWLEDPLGTGEVLATKRRDRGWDNAEADQLTEGLEQSVKNLFHGTVSTQLPWNTEASSNVSK